MQRDDQASDVTELGSVSRDTLGGDGKYWEGFADMPAAGLTDD